MLTQTTNQKKKLTFANTNIARASLRTLHEDGLDFVFVILQLHKRGSI